MNADYPYKMKRFSCNKSVSVRKYVNPTDPFYVIRGVKNISYYLTKNGPLGTDVFAFNWFDYESGIFTDCNEGDAEIANHAVTIVGN